MAGEWRSVPFAQLCEHSAFGPRFAGDLYAMDGNVATLRTTDISADGRIEYDTMPLARLDLSKQQQHTLRRNDLVITRSGRIGTAALFDGFHLPVLPGAFLIRFRLKTDIADPFYYRYFFNSPAGQELLNSVATGSVQQNLNITSVHGLQVPMPPLHQITSPAGGKRRPEPSHRRVPRPGPCRASCCSRSGRRSSGYRLQRTVFSWCFPYK